MLVPVELLLVVYVVYVVYVIGCVIGFLFLELKLLSLLLAALRTVRGLTLFFLFSLRS